MDGTKFILRIPGYQQKAAFADFSGDTIADITKTLKPRQTDSDELVRLMSGAIQIFRAEEIQRRTLGNPVFGKPVDHTKARVTTKLMKRYENFALEALLRVFGDEASQLKDLEAVFNFKDDSGVISERCKLRRVNTVPLLESPAGKIHPQKIKAAINHFYSVAEDQTKPRPERRDAALKWYSLSSGFCHFEAGSAMAAHWGLEILLNRQDATLPHLKPGVDLNLQANTRSIGDFIDKINSGEWFDFNVTAQQMRAWQAAEIEFAKTAMHEEFPTAEILAQSVVRIRNGAPITTPKKALLKRMLENTDSRFPAVEIGRDTDKEDGVYQVRFHNYNIDYLGLPEIFLQMRDGHWLSTERSNDSLNIWKNYVAERKTEYAKQLKHGRC